MTQKKKYPNLRFKSLEEEREYWEGHSPLVEGYEGKVQCGRQKLSSYFALRLTGQEITRLRDAAARKNLTVSAYARQVLMSAVEESEQPSKPVRLKDLGALLEEHLAPQTREQIDSLIKATAIGNAERPALFVIDASQMKTIGAIAKVLLPLLFSLAGVTMVSPENKEYHAMRELVRS